MTFLLTGGTGFIGKRIRELLLQDGHQLIVITRSPRKYQVEGVKNEVFIGWDEDLTSVMDRADVVINLAGESVFGQKWTDDVKKSIYDSRVLGTRKLVDAMRDCSDKPGLFISASAIGYYGEDNKDVLDEESPKGSDFLAQVTIDWEAEALKAEALDIKVSIPRIGIVLEKDGGALEKMIPPFSFFVGGPIGDGKQYMSWIHLDDAARAILHPIDNAELTGAYNVVAPNPETMNDFCSKLGDVMHRPSIFRVPEFVVEIMFGEAANTILGSINVQPKVLQKVGFEFEYIELEDALNDIL